MKTDKKIIRYQDLKKIRQTATKEGKKIVFTSGCYDLLHIGHITHFRFCKKKGDVLVVSIGNDATVKMLKGPTRPINDQIFRALLVAAIELVDYVIISEEFGKMDHNLLIELLRPEIYVVNADDSAIPEKRCLVRKHGGRITKRCSVLRVGDEVHSVTRIERKIQSSGKSSEYKNLRIVIATHVFAPGPAQDLRDYLIGAKVNKLLFIGHPLFYQPELKGSGYELYFGETGETKQVYSKITNNFGVGSYVKDFLKNICYVIKSGKKWDLYVGSDNLNALSGVVLKKLGVVKKCVYYVIDYNPKRFPNKLLNKIYHKIDQFCVKYCDETWNLSVRMKEGRNKYFNFSGGNQITVPIGIWFKDFKRVNFSQVEKNTLVYMGHVLKKQGIQHVLSATPWIVKKIPKFRFKIVGYGEYLPELKKQVKTLGISSHIEFLDKVRTSSEVEQILPRCALAVAMYEKFDEADNLSYTYFADPGKLKSYLASGLPILLTDVPHNAKEIEKLKCGKIITSEQNSISNAVIGMLKNEKKLAKMRQNAIKYAEKYDWNLIFEKNLKRVLY